MSVASNHIPGDEIELLNWMCVLVLTRGNESQFDATSIQEENIIQLCIEMGQTHPEGVLQFLVTESVVMFHSSNENAGHGVWSHQSHGFAQRTH